MRGGEIFPKEGDILVLTEKFELVVVYGIIDRDSGLLRVYSGRRREFFMKHFPEEVTYLPDVELSNPITQSLISDIKNSTYYTSDYPSSNAGRRNIVNGGDKLPGYGDFVLYKFQGDTLLGVSAGVIDPDAAKISVYIPENDDFETMEFPTEVKSISRSQLPLFAKQIRRIKLSNDFSERFPSLVSGGRTRRRKHKNKKTRKR